MGRDRSRRERKRRSLSSSDSSSDDSDGSRRDRPRKRDDRGQHKRRHEGDERGESAAPTEAPTAAPQPPQKALGYKKLKKLRNQMLESTFGYSDLSNPFGDSKLAEPFVWRKKHQLLKAAGKYEKPTTNSFLDNTKTKLMEIESVKKRREDREREEAMLEEQRALMAREREQENYDEWARKEEAFHRMTALKGTEIRLQQGRERPVDLLVKALRLVDGEQFEDLHLLDCSPVDLFEGMKLEEVQELMEDIRSHYISSGAGDAEGHHIAAMKEDELPFSEFLRGDKPSEAQSEFDEETKRINQQESKRRQQTFWRAMMTIAENALEKARKAAAAPQQPASMMGMEEETPTMARDEESGIPLVVQKKIEKLLSSKSPTELELLDVQVTRKLKGGEEDVDVAYWELIQSQIPLYKARAEVLRIYEKAPIRAKEIRQRQKVTEKPNLTVIAEEEDEEGRVETASPAELEASVKAQRTLMLEEDGYYSPPLEPYGDVKDDETLVDPSELPESGVRREAEEAEELLDKSGKMGGRGVPMDASRSSITISSVAMPITPILDTSASSTMLFERFVNEEKRGMGADEIVMGGGYDASLPQQSFEWEDKYKPRKPRFFNRVKTGYEWNKYNQTHYDHENPPPKAVQGYKFNVFYPDLIDKTKAPTWKLEPSDTADTVLIRFHAGPPYEDVAFKIINREWEVNPRRGFKNCFDRGILQLYFNFKRYRYRR